MRDALDIFLPIARRRSEHIREGDYVLATLHRDANVVMPRLGRILEGLASITDPVIFPLHPRTRAAIEANGLHVPEHIETEDPIGYLDMLALASRARVIVTDSGGIQKEAYWYGVPCVTARPSTEWVDTIEQGANVLVDDDPELLAAAVAAARPLPPDRLPLYGDGTAAARIAEALCTLFGR
jgi:UDP-N-acetylglucosamine 2-epimerase